MTNEMIAKLENKGFSRWTKGRFDRLYINARDLGLSCTYHRTGSEDTSMFGSVSISNSEARRMKSTKCYIDVATGEVVCDNDMMREAAEAILAECEEPEAAEEINEEESEVEVEAAKVRAEIDAAQEARNRDAVAEAIERDVAEVKKQAEARNVPAAIVEKTLKRITLIRDYFASCPISDLRAIIDGVDLRKVGSAATAIKYAMHPSIKDNLEDKEKFGALVKGCSSHPDLKNPQNIMNRHSNW